jgi:L-rhamnose mutarotase
MIFSTFKTNFLLILMLSAILVTCQQEQTKDPGLVVKPTDVRRYGQVIRVKPEKLDHYKDLHANPWPCVLEKIRECNIRNYSIYLQGDQLFAYFEYVGDDFTADMEKMAADSCTQRWWKETDPCQEPIAGAKEGDWWTTMEEVFHSD